LEAATHFVSQLIAHRGYFVMVAEHDGVVVGSNFLDERSTIFGAGPITVDPEVQDHQIGRARMTPVLDEWAARGAPGVRLLICLTPVSTFPDPGVVVALFACIRAASVFD
jgi:predicted N-acetyltransferase YhbS